MNNLRRRFERFCFQNRDKGIPNLMLYICLGSGLVTFTNLMNGGDILYNFLRFDKGAILQGEVWRLVSWLLTEQLSGIPLLSVLFLYFFYRLGRAVEMSIGTFKFNLFYLGGVVLMDLFAMIFCPIEVVTIEGVAVPPELFTMLYSDMAYYLHLSMVLAFSTMYPENQFMIFFIIPVKAWVLALIDLILIGISVFNMCYPVMLFPHCLFPLIGILTYLIFFGGVMHNLLPLSWRIKARRFFGKKTAPQQTKSVPFAKIEVKKVPVQQAKPDYTHRCTICGRTDVSHPQLEFRYCSKCNGYFCYCEDHISNHTHVE